LNPATGQYHHQLVANDPAEPDDAPAANRSGEQWPVKPPKSVLARGLSLLDAFGPTDEQLSLAELARRAALPKPTAYRLAKELVEWGGLERSARGYRLGLALFELGQRVPRRRELREAALPYMEDLYEATHENVHLSVLDGVNILFLEKVSGHRSMPIGSRVGVRMPAYCTATGKVLLAYGRPELFAEVVSHGLARFTARTIVAPGMLRADLERTVARGYGVNREEAEVGVSAVAAPIFDHQKRVMAAMSITGYAHRLDLDQLAPAVRTAALALSRELARETARRSLTWPRATTASN
jgi:DNA-binding IclR family transcriptional regulator